jgi:hypothetical protein
MDDLRTPLRRLEPEVSLVLGQDPLGAKESPKTAEQEKDSGFRERIEDPVGVLRLALLQERMLRIQAEKQTRPAWYEARIAQAIRQLNEERNRKMAELQQEEAESTAEMKMMREFLAEKHGIDLSSYSYDDATGTLLLLPQD